MTPHEVSVEVGLVLPAEHAELRRMYAEQTRILHGFDASIVPDQTLQSDWWEKPGDLFPYMIRRDGA